MAFNVTEVEQLVTSYQPNITTELSFIQHLNKTFYHKIYEISIKLYGNVFEVKMKEI